LYDMHGNVGEWCEDSEKAPNGEPWRVWRGGSWSSFAEQCRASSHHAMLHRQAQDNVGLRLARVPAGKENSAKQK
jgi:formylglycine-generating enzyme required for sulfatase activity